jgi:Holliday junction resolvase RusA-like endonuclease
MFKTSQFIKRMGEQFPQTKKATTKPLWEKWISERQAPTHKQMMKLLSLIPVDDVQRKIYLEHAFVLAKYPKKIARWEKTFHIHPMACPRPRFTRYGSPYMPKKYIEWKKNLVDIIKQEKMDMLVNPIQMELEFHFYNENKPWGTHTQKPDIDNLIKACMDGFQDSGLLSDDCIVYDVRGSKFWSYEPKIVMIIKH